MENPMMSRTNQLFYRAKNTTFRENREQKDFGFDARSHSGSWKQEIFSSCSYKKFLGNKHRAHTTRL